MNKSVQISPRSNLIQVFAAYGTNDEVMKNVSLYHMKKAENFQQYDNWTRDNVFDERNHVLINHGIDIWTWNIGKASGTLFYASKNKLEYKWPMRNAIKININIYQYQYNFFFFSNCLSSRFWNLNEVFCYIFTWI